jgi:hypothetical protein
MSDADVERLLDEGLEQAKKAKTERDAEDAEKIHNDEKQYVVFWIGICVPLLYSSL